MHMPTGYYGTNSILTYLLTIMQTLVLQQYQKYFTALRYHGFSFRTTPPRDQTMKEHLKLFKIHEIYKSIVLGFFSFLAHQRTTDWTLTGQELLQKVFPRTQRAQPCVAPQNQTNVYLYRCTVRQSRTTSPSASWWRHSHKAWRYGTPNMIMKHQNMPPVADQVSVWAEIIFLDILKTQLLCGIISTNCFISKDSNSDNNV